MQENEYYKTLGISNKAATPEIRKAYATKIKKYSNEQYPEEFIRIREAYDVLSNEESRRSYDRLLDSMDRYNDKLSAARREMDRSNYSSARAILEELIREFPDDRTVRLEFDHCILQMSQSGRSQSSSSNNTTLSTPNETKKEDSGFNFWGCCVCIIIIYVAYQMFM